MLNNIIALLLEIIGLSVILATTSGIFPFLAGNNALGYVLIFIGAIIMSLGFYVLISQEETNSNRTISQNQPSTTTQLPLTATRTSPPVEFPDLTFAKERINREIEHLRIESLKSQKKGLVIAVSGTIILFVAFFGSYVVYQEELEVQYLLIFEALLQLLALFFLNRGRALEKDIRRYVDTQTIIDIKIQAIRLDIKHEHSKEIINNLLDYIMPAPTTQYTLLPYLELKKILKNEPK